MAVGASLHGCSSHRLGREAGNRYSSLNIAPENGSHCRLPGYFEPGVLVIPQEAGADRARDADLRFVPVSAHLGRFAHGCQGGRSQRAGTLPCGPI